MKGTVVARTTGESGEKELIKPYGELSGLPGQAWTEEALRHGRFMGECQPVDAGL
jgi:hypothetical protein